MQDEATSPPVEEEQILKQKKPRKPLDPETKKKMGDHMRKINQERIEKARIASEARLEKKEEAIAEIAMKKLESIERKKQGIRKLKEDRGVIDPVPVPEPAPEPPKSKPRPKTRKQVVIECSSDSGEDSSDTESEAELIYVQKKKRGGKKSDNSIVKPKKQNTINSEPVQEAPRTIIKFI